MTRALGEEGAILVLGTEVQRGDAADSRSHSWAGAQSAVSNLLFFSLHSGLTGFCAASLHSQLQVTEWVMIIVVPASSRGTAGPVVQSSAVG